LLAIEKRELSMKEWNHLDEFGLDLSVGFVGGLA
jgi:hypothetical protein